MAGIWEFELSELHNYTLVRKRNDKIQQTTVDKINKTVNSISKKLKINTHLQHFAPTGAGGDRSFPVLQAHLIG